jgi:dienelactone hydrolase
MRWLIAGMFLLASASQAADTGLHTFPSAGSLQRDAASEPFALSSATVTLTGELIVPEGAGPFPAVVLVHGCEGNRHVEGAWGPFLRGAGYATFNVDSLGARGLEEVCTQPGALAPVQRVADVYGALRYLAAHPKVDAERVALMGFSHGGIVTMLSSTRWAKDSFAPEGRPAFRAFLPFYPFCNPVFPERDHISAPVRIHTGAADDWTPAEPCAELVASLKASGQDATITVYPDAAHSFDQARASTYLSAVANAADCRPQLPSILGPVDPSSIANCIKKGAHVGGSAGAADQARKHVRAQLDDLLE